MARKIEFMSMVFALALVTLIIAGCEPQLSSGQEPVRQNLIVYGFSTEEEVLTKEIFPAFQAYWKQQAGEEVTFRSVFTGSEELVNAILNGGMADVAILSNEQHATWLHINDYVTTNWQSFPHEGVISQSPIVIVVRPGNPLQIQDWADLGRPGVKVLHPDPRSSGGAQWAVLAEYGSALLTSGNQASAQEQLENIWKNIIASPPSAREALRQFLFGTGDALVTYEQDALLAQSRGAEVEIIIPSTTIMSEHIAIMVDRNVNPWEQKVVRAFVNFMWSNTTQEAFTRYYFRAVTSEQLNQATPAFQKIEHPFTVRELGGWGQAYPYIINNIWKEQIAP